MWIVVSLPVMRRNPAGERRGLADGQERVHEDGVTGSAADSAVPDELRDPRCTQME
jgi:hypothetical protein